MVSIFNPYSSFKVIESQIQKFKLSKRYKDKNNDFLTY